MALKTAAGLVLLLAGFTRVNSPEGWAEPTPGRAVSGEASYYAPGIMAAVANRRGLDLAGYRGGVAMMRRGDIGREVWILAEGSEEWAGPFLVVDCAQRIHYPGLVDRGRVIELDRADWRVLGLPDGPAPVVVSFVGPWPAPRVRWL